MEKVIRSLNSQKGEYMDIQDFFNALLGEDVFTKESNEKYIPQLGDKVQVITGQFKDITGEIIAEVKGYEKYQIKVDEFNAVYVDKESIKVIEKRIDAEKMRKEKINKLKQEIAVMEVQRNKLANDLNLMEDKLDDTYKQLEALED